MGNRNSEPTPREIAAATRKATGAVGAVRLRDVPLPRVRVGDYATSHLNGYSAKAQSPFPGVVGQNATAPSARRSSTPTTTKAQPTAASIAAAPQGSKSVAVDTRPLRRGVGDGGGRRSAAATTVSRHLGVSPVPYGPPNSSAAMTPTTTGTVSPASRRGLDVTKRSMGPDDLGDVKSALLANTHDFVTRHGHGMSNCNYNKR
jgi:hypothetical protein